MKSRASFCVWQMRLQSLICYRQKIGSLQPEAGEIFRTAEYKSLNFDIIIRELSLDLLTIPLFYTII